MFNLFGKLLDTNARELKKFQPLVEKINSLEPAAKKLAQKDFSVKTAAFRECLAKGETLDDLLPEAFALIREMIYRTVGERAYDVQLLAAICLHQGKIAEQKTGEGKTLSAAMAAYLNGLVGQGVHVVTTNDYLARRDTGWYGQALQATGLSLSCIVHEEAFLLDPAYEQAGQTDDRLRHLRPIERQEAYQADVTYGTNNEFGFDYLRDNMAFSADQMVQRGHHFAIVDEVDSILIDEARTPLIISAPDTEPTQKYYDFARLIQGLEPETDYVIDEKLKTANLTEYGIRRVERKLGVDNLYEKDFDTIKHVENALRARTLFLRDRDYVVKDDQVTIVDEFTGRLMPGRRWSEGLHQAVEAKEGVKIQQESITLATISFQNYFRMYDKLAGMTGTAATEAEEFEKIYHLPTVVIPTNQPMIRRNYPDVVYKTVRAKYAAVVREIIEHYQRKQPVLVGTNSIEKNEIIAHFLDRKGLPYNLLNAKQHEREARILADAGRLGSVTVATNMAGRGVDIVLGGDRQDRDPQEWQKEHAQVVKLGGLHIIGTERHESRRIDNQLRGRAGRQGDPGSSRFFVSLEDDIMRLFGGERIARLMEVLKIPEGQPIEHGMVSKAIEQAQGKVEAFNFEARKRVVEYDDVMNKQREIIYGKRRQIPDKKALKTLFGQEIENLVRMHTAEENQPDYEQILVGFFELLPLDVASQQRLKADLTRFKKPAQISELLNKLVDQAYGGREKQFGSPTMRQIEKFVWLQTIDRLWIDHLDAMDDLREGVGLRGYAQQDPLVEYKKQAFDSFERLVGTIDQEVVRRLFRIQVAQPPVMSRQAQTNEDRQDGIGLIGLSSSSDGAQRTPPRWNAMGSTNRPVAQPVRPHHGQKKLGRNDPCWCGSGKKWKRCHYPQLG